MIGEGGSSNDSIGWFVVIGDGSGIVWGFWDVSSAIFMAGGTVAVGNGDCERCTS